MLLDDQRLAGEFLHVIVADAEFVAQLDRGVLGPDPFAGRAGIHHAQLLGAEVAAQDGRLAVAQGRLEHVELVRIDRTLHDHLAEAVRACDEHHVAEARLGVQREQHAGRAHVRAHHQLHAGGEEHVLVLEALVHAVGDRAIVVQRGEDFLHLVQHVVDADHVEEGFLLTGERGIRQVFSGSRRTHGHRDIVGAGILAQLDVGRADRLLEFGGQGGIDDPAADILAGRHQGVDVVDVERGQPVLDALGQTALFQILLERAGRGRETAGHGDPELGEVADHLAEGGILAADLAQVGHAQLVEPKHQVVQGCLLRKLCR